MVEVLGPPEPELTVRGQLSLSYSLIDLTDTSASISSYESGYNSWNKE